MENITIKRLRQAGWKESRKINIDIIKKRYKEIGLEMPLNIQLDEEYFCELLKEYEINKK